jgi:hypothetical protein
VRFQITHDYPASPDRLWSALGRRDYPARKYAALGSPDLKLLRFRATPRVIEVEFERKVQAALEVVPAWARPLMEGEQRMRQYGLWRRINATRIEAELEIGLMDLPISAKAAGIGLAVGPEQTRLAFRFDVTCRLLAFRGTAARLFADQVRAAMREDHAFTLAYLAGASGASPTP